MTSRGRSRRSTLVAGLAVLLALGACTAQPEPSPAASSPTPSATSSTEPSEAPTPDTPLPPEKPAAMANDDEPGARAAADYFLALYGYTYQSGSFTLLDALCHDESTFCQGVEEEVSAQESAGQTFIGGDVTWKGEPTMTKKEGGSAYAVEGTLSQSEATVYGPVGSVEQTAAAGDVPATVFVYYQAGEWFCFDISLES